MKHYFSSKVRVVIVVAVLLALALTVIGGLTGLSLPEMFVKGVLTPVRSGASKLTEQAEQYYSYIFNYEKLEAENAQLKEQIARMEDDARVADAVARENDYLRSLLELKQDNEDYVLEDAYIIAWSSPDWSSTITVNKGSNDGIVNGMCAITANGEVVGLVTEVGTNYSVVKTVLDSSLEVSATIASSGYNGMVSGGYASGYEDMLRMDYLPSKAVIRNNDQVVTAGSTVYPRGLIMGHIVDADFDDTGVAKFAILEPAADIDTLELVFIVTQFQVE